MLPVPDEVLGNRLRAVISLYEGALLTREEVLAFCNQQLPHYMVPDVIEFRGALGPGAHELSWSGRDDGGRALPGGVYFARLIRNDTGGASHVPFIVRDDDGHSDLLFRTSDTTWSHTSPGRQR